MAQTLWAATDLQARSHLPAHPPWCPTAWGFSGAWDGSGLGQSLLAGLVGSLCPCPPSSEQFLKLGLL